VDRLPLTEIYREFSYSIFKLTAAYKEDKHEQKVNLGVGAYRDDNNKPWVLPVVKKVSNSCFTLSFKLIVASLQATAILLNDASLDHEYLPILGLPEYTKAAARLLLGADCIALKEDRVVTAQTISGTGANHLGALFLSKFYKWNGPPKIYLSNPTWGGFR